MTDLDIRDALMAGWLTLARREGILDRACILATRVGIGTLQHYGIEAEPFPCHVLVANAEAWYLTLNGVPVEEWPDSAHSIGVGHGAPWRDNGWDGHLLIRTADVLGDVLIDLAARQFHRPGRIEVPGPIKVMYEGERSIAVDNLGQRYVIESTEDKAYRQANDWRRNWRPLVPKMVELVERAA